MDTTDIVKASKVLGGHLCISGNVPCSLIQTGSAEQVTTYCKEMIDTCARDGGFIMSTRSPVDDAQPELLKAMIDCTIDYGTY
jgi:uroporphyrinogen-III decarboxylase